jgi:hypothetical protein
MRARAIAGTEALPRSGGAGLAILFVLTGFTAAWSLLITPGPAHQGTTALTAESIFG